VAKAYFGDTDRLPRQGEAFDIYAILTAVPMPATSSSPPTGDYIVSDVITAHLVIVTWWKRAVRYLLDIPVSGPINTAMLFLGGLVGAFIRRRR
jgi:hypothetical protein